MKLIGDYLCRIDNKYLGMLSEVRDGYADISVAAFGWSTVNEGNTSVHLHPEFLGAYPY